MAELMAPATRSAGGEPWWREMSPYHWLVFAIASVSWLFDCMDQRFFIIARQPALRSLLGPDVPATQVADYGRLATAMILAGWAAGGLFFGMLGDRIGRVRTMMITILVYSGFTGLSAISVHWWDFIIYRFLMGLGVGGLFAAAVSLVAEVVPPRARPHALGLLQALSALGNILGSAISGVLKPQSTGWLGLENWRWLFVVGVLPALLVGAIQWRLKEPESWKRAKTRAAEDLQRQLGAWGDLFNPGLRRNTLVGLTLAISGVIGLWAIAFFTPELIRDALKDRPGDFQDSWVSNGLILQDVGAFFGIYFFTLLAARLGRRPAFAFAFLLALGATVMTFQYLERESDIYWMLPLLGFATLAVFGGYAIYFPELYPTRLRSSGVGFCYNVGRIIAAAALFPMNMLDGALKSQGVQEPFRMVSTIAAAIYLLGLIALLWAPETKDRPLPE